MSKPSCAGIRGLQCIVACSALHLSSRPISISHSARAVAFLGQAAGMVCLTACVCLQALACQYSSQVGNGGSPAALARRLPAIAEALLRDGEDQICITAADPCPPALLACFQVGADCVHSSCQSRSQAG